MPSYFISGVTFSVLSWFKFAVGITISELSTNGTGNDSWHIHTEYYTVGISP
jgi:hypothetical protein